MGAVTPIGHDIKTLWKNLVCGTTGIRRIKNFATDTFPTKIAAEISGFNPTAHGIAAKEAKHLSRFSQYALAAANQAITDSGLSISDTNRHDIGIFVGSSLGGWPDCEASFARAILRGWKKIPFAASVANCNHAPAFSIACHHGITGPTITLSTACNSSMNALEVATDQLRLGKVRAAIVVGVDVLSEMTFASFCKTRGMSRLNDYPELASRPFDIARDGFVAGEAAAALLLEPAALARKRGASIYAGIGAVASTNDAFQPYQCEPSGKEISGAMVKALKAAEVTTIDYISAHGPSIKATDIAETIAIKRLFNSSAPPVSSLKGQTGCPLGASNIIQIIAAALTMIESVIPPTINLDDQDPDCDLDYVPNIARDALVQSAALNSHGFGGGNCCCIVTKA